MKVLLNILLSLWTLFLGGIAIGCFTEGTLFTGLIFLTGAALSCPIILNKLPINPGGKVIATMLPLFIGMMFLGGGGSSKHEITAKKLKQPWPLTVEKVTAHAVGQALYVKHEGQKYALNGVALKDKRAKPIDEIAIPSETGVGYKHSVGELLVLVDGMAGDLLDKRKELTDRAFNSWDGSHVKLTSYIKNILHVPSSYEHIETKYFDDDETIFVITKYRA